jgi:N-methylhydantoinase B
MSGSDAFDTIRMQVMWNRLISVVEEQAQTLMRTAFSPIVRECGDLSAGVFDVDGRMLAQAVTGTPGHVNSMAESVKHFIAHFPPAGMREGDIYITNDPWMGTGHLNDFVLTTPCFKDGRLVALFSCTSHITDIGGIGTGPDGTDVHMEGIFIPTTAGRWTKACWP